MTVGVRLVLWYFWIFAHSGQLALVHGPLIADGRTPVEGTRACCLVDRTENVETQFHFDEEFQKNFRFTLMMGSHAQRVNITAKKKNRAIVHEAVQLAPGYIEKLFG